MASKKYTFKDFLRECREAIKIVWTKIWGEDLPKDMTKLYPDEEYTTAEQFKYYEKDKKNLSKRRIKASLLLIIVFLIGFNISKNIFEYIRTSEFVSCFGKDVCIYRGPNLPKGDGYLRISTDNIPFFYLGIDNKSKPNIFKNFKIIDKLIYKFKVYNYGKSIFVFYDTKTNKFKKILIESNKGLYPYYYDNKIYFHPLFHKDDKIKEVEIYNMLTNEYETIDISLNYNSSFLGIVNFDNYIMLMTVNNIYNEKHPSREYPEVTNQESIYIFDLNTLSLKPFVNFKINPKYYPPYVKTISTNKKIIIPIAVTKVIFNRNAILHKTLYDHTEIYDKEKNMFYADMNKDAITENILQIKMDNGNILFLNKKESYIFDDEINAFKKISNKNEQEKIENITNKILYYMYNYFKIDEYTDLHYRYPVISLTKNKFLILKNEDQEEKKLLTIFVDYDRNIVKKGPNMPFYYSKNKEFEYNSKKYIIGRVCNDKQKSCKPFKCYIIKTK